MQNQRSEHLNEELSSLEKNTLATILQALADPALTRLEADDLSHAVLQCLREMMTADNLAILLLTEDHTALHIHTVLGLEETVAHEVYIPVGRGFAGQIITQRLPFSIHDSSSTLEIITPVLRKELRSLLGVPLIVHQQVIGVIHVGMKREYLFTDADIALLQQVADHLAQAFERTLLIEAEQHEFEELIEAQLCAVVELVEAQQRMAGELMEAQQRTARELMEAQRRMAGELVEAQQPTAEGLVEAQQRVATKLMKEQLLAAGELVEAQLPTAEGLVEVQQRVATELVKAQQHTAGELVKAQQQVATELVEAQLHTARELVEQQRIHLKALEHVNKLDTIFNAIMDGIVVYDEYGSILRSNRAANHFLGLETHSTEMNTYSPSSWEKTYQLRGTDGRPFSHEHLPLKHLLSGERLAASQGVIIHLNTLDERDVQLSVTGSPLYTQQGHLYGAVCVLRDVTTRKNMERRVEILEVLLQMVELLVKSSAQKEQETPLDDTALAIQQIESNILALAQRLLGCSHAVILGTHQNMSPLALLGFSNEQEQHLRSGLADAHLNLLIDDSDQITLLEKQENVPFVITRSPLLQSLFSMSSSQNCYLVPIYVTHQFVGLLGLVFPEGASLPDAKGIALITAISKLCALALQYEQQTTERDLLMTAKSLLNEQLQQANKMQGDFISVVSHEFRTSLTTIEGFSDLLRSEEYPSEDVKDYASNIYTDAIRLHRMVTDLLDLEQMKKGKTQLRMVWIDMNTLLTTIVKHMALVSTHHTLRLSLDEKLPQIEGDADKLIQAITNVLSNAVKYSPMGGEILLKSSREETSIHVSIQDQGIGIAPEVIKNIFTPHHRVNSSSTRYIEGSGLGLSLVREIIELHKGKIWVESSPGHGSTFHFTLPLYPSTGQRDL